MAEKVGGTVRLATAQALVRAYARARDAARATQRPVVVVCRTDPSAWTESGAWWEVGVPAGLAGRAAFEASKPRQLRWVRSSAEKRP